MKIKILKKMKNRILSIITLSVVLLGFTKSSIAATTNNAKFTVLNEISKINKIEVHGNVELFLSDGPADQVKVYNHYYAESALVQSKNGVLRITSYNPEKLIVWVTANDLRSISAFDNADVKSFGKLSKIDLEIDLHNNASAKLNLDAYDTSLTMTDHSKADLTGAVDELSLNHNKASMVTDGNLVVVKLVENNNTNVRANAEREDIAGL